MSSSLLLFAPLLKYDQVRFLYLAKIQEKATEQRREPIQMKGDIYNTLYPALGQKIVFIRHIQPELREKYTNERFKSLIVRDILDSASKKILEDTEATTFAKEPPTNKRISYKFLYSLDHLEYRGKIYKNLRKNGVYEEFELHLSNDGFFYKDVLSKDFPQDGRVPDWDRADSQEWYYMSKDSFHLVEQQVEKLAEIFNLKPGWQFDWLYNSEIMRMEFIIYDSKRTLRVELEPGFPEYDHRHVARRISYQQLRGENQQKQNF